MHAKVIVVGAGFAGIGLTRQLKRAGIEDVVVLERGEDVGGVWRANTYPGCTCDVPSHLYSFSWAPNPEWTNTFSPQPEIQAYLRGVAERSDVVRHIRFGVSFDGAAWDEDAQLWRLETSAGPMTAQVLVSAVGPLTEPSFPEVPGIESFRGTLMHSARWDHEHDLTGERVASIGTGASAIQYVPEIAPQVDKLLVFQRTAPWITAHTKRPITERERRLYRRAPLAQKAVRGAVYTAKELLVLGFVKRPALMDVLAKLSKKHLADQVADLTLREQLTPEYSLGCKRIVPSNAWYPALTRDNVELLPTGLAEVREHSVVGVDGVEHQVDTIIFGTGYHVTDIPVAEHLRGRDGLRLSDHWQGSPRAYLGATVPGFPNLFLMLGPNTGLGHSSMVYMIESQIDHVVATIQAMDRAGASAAEVTREVHDAYNRQVDAKMAGTVWDIGGCRSFYLDATGRNATLWPDWTWQFRRQAQRNDPAAYTLTTRQRAGAAR
ncbi:MAG: NAD(P)/FAD-dependent oxidoreductase [Nocardioides sp.]